MNKPSLKRLEAAFPGKGKEIKELLAGKSKTTDYHSVRAWEEQCYRRPSCGERVMCALNEILEGFGVEAVFAPDNAGEPPLVTYVNMGDTYADTILRDADGRFMVASWGDYV